MGNWAKLYRAATGAPRRIDNSPGSLLPFEIYEICRRFTLPKAAGLVINVGSSAIW
jgi:hypothetical protein